MPAPGTGKRRAAIWSLGPVLLGAWLLVSCAAPSGADRQEPSGTGPIPAGTETVDLVDPAYAKPLQGDYRRAAAADVDGDGQEEQVVVLAAVERVRGDPGAAYGLDDFAWDDGQPWQVYVEEPDGRRTYLFSQFVQLGAVDGLLDPDNRRIWIVVETGMGIEIYEVVHEDPDTYRARRAFSAYGTRWTAP